MTEFIASLYYFPTIYSGICNPRELASWVRMKKVSTPVAEITKLPPHLNPSPDSWNNTAGVFTEAEVALPVRKAGVARSYYLGFMKTKHLQRVAKVDRVSVSVGKRQSVESSYCVADKHRSAFRVERAVGSE